MMKNSLLLAVDDKSENLFLIRELIAEHLPECKVITTQSAEEGLSIAAERNIDAAILDVQMPVVRPPDAGVRDAGDGDAGAEDASVP